MSHGIDPIQVQILAALLFAIGIAVVLTRRNLFFVLMGIELMLNAVNLSFIEFARHFADGHAGQLVPLFVFAIAAAEACIGLAMVICLFRHSASVDADAYASMKD